LNEKNNDRIVVVFRSLFLCGEGRGGGGGGGGYPYKKDGGARRKF